MEKKVTCRVCFFNSHFNSNNINSILELNYMNFFYKNEILSHHEYTECRAAECPFQPIGILIGRRELQERNVDLGIVRNWVSSASFQITARVICPTAGDYFMTQIIEKWIENF